MRKYILLLFITFIVLFICSYIFTYQHTILIGNIVFFPILILNLAGPILVLFISYLLLKKIKGLKASIQKSILLIVATAFVIYIYFWTLSLLAMWSV